MEKAGLTIRGRIGDRSLAFELSDGEFILGRAAECDLRLDEPSVSRRHARLRVAGTSMAIEDLGSSNGTRVNGELTDGATTLGSGDQLVLGHVQLQVGSGSQTNQFLADQTMVRENLSVSIDEVRRTTLGERGKKAHLFRILAEAGELLTNPGDPEEMFDPLLALVEQALQPERAVLLLLEDGETRVAASRTSSGDAGEMVLSRTLLGRVIDEKQAFLTEDASQDERLLGGDSLVGARVRSAMAAPLFDNENIIGVLYADSSNPAVNYDRDELKAFVLLANIIGVAITHARYHALEEERRRMATELGAARRIMSRLLPRELPEIPGLSLTVSLDPCEEVAGDLYDVRLLPDGRLLLVVGDVAGKGLPAALIVAAMLPAIRIVADQCGDLGVFTKRINDQLFAATDTVRFATLFLGLLDPVTGELEFVNAGHNPPLLGRGDGSDPETLPAAGPPVGMVPDMTYTSSTINLPPGGHLVIYSDGITETQDASEDQYGDDRLFALVRDCPNCPPADLQRQILAAVDKFADGEPPTDDRTLLLLRREA